MFLQVHLPLGKIINPNSSKWTNVFFFLGTFSVSPIIINVINHITNVIITKLAHLTWGCLTTYDVNFFWDRQQINYSDSLIKRVQICTCIQQFLHHPEVRMGHAVMQCCVAILVSHVSHLSKNSRWYMTTHAQKTINCLWTCFLLTGRTEPVLLDYVQTGTL